MEQITPQRTFNSSTIKDKTPLHERLVLTWIDSWMKQDKIIFLLYRTTCTAQQEFWTNQYLEVQLKLL